MFSSHFFTDQFAFIDDNDYDDDEDDDELFLQNV